MSRGRREKRKQRRRRKLGLPFGILVLILIGIGVTVYRDDLLGNFLPSKQVQEFTSSSSSSFSSRPKSDLPDVSSKDWELVLVNRKNPKDEMNPKLADVENIQVDSRIAEATQQFLAAARQIAPEEALNSGYRSVEEQKELYDQTVAGLEAAGMSHDEAEQTTQKQVQIPGASEHQTGLAIDMSVPTGQSDELAAQITAIAPDYGFVLRFPDAKSDITGIDFENWHYRYVGVASAKYMQQHNLVLEEYLDKLKAEGK